MVTHEPPSDATSAAIMALNWASIGRCVRQRTLEAVAAHFAGVGERALAEVERSRGLKPAARTEVRAGE